MENSMKNERIQWIDIAKGIGISLVLIGHMEIANPLLVFIESFHMALFFFLSGFTFNGSVDFKTFLGKKAKNLLLPYLSLGILYTPFVIATAGDSVNVIETTIHWLKELLFFQQEGHIWFVGALFWANVLYYFLNKFLSNPYLKLAVSAVCFALGYAYTNFVGTLPWSIHIAFMALLFLCVGNLYRNSKLYANRRPLSLPKLLVLMGTWAVCFLLYYTNGGVTNFHSGTWSYLPFSILLALLGTAAIICLSEKISCKPLAYLGQNSMIYYMWQWIGFTIAYRSWEIFHLIHSDILFLIYEFVVAMCVLTACSLVFQLTKLKVLMGKF